MAMVVVIFDLVDFLSLSPLAANRATSSLLFLRLRGVLVHKISRWSVIQPLTKELTHAY